MHEDQPCDHSCCCDHQRNDPQGVQFGKHLLIGTDTGSQDEQQVNYHCCLDLSGSLGKPFVFISGFLCILIDENPNDDTYGHNGK